MPAKSKAKAKAKAIKAIPAKKTSAIPAKAPESESDVKTRRRLDRRDSDQRMDRACEGKLFENDWAQLVGKVSPKDETPTDYIKEELRRKKDKNGRLTTAFWIGFRKDFGLVTGGDIGDKLDDPPEEPVDQNLVQMLLTAHSDNPAQDKVSPITSYLEHCPELNQASLYGLFNRIEECPSLPRVVAYKIQVAVLAYLERILHTY